MAQSGVEAPPQVNLDVIVAQATPPGESAVGMIRLSGADCVNTAGACMRWPRHELEPRRAVLSKIFDGDQLLDEAVVTYFPGPSSYTGEDMLEICTHGSPYVLARTLSLLARNGARPAQPGEFTQRAYLHGRMDLAQAEAVCGLIRAKTAWANRAALSQLQGGLSTKVSALRSKLVDLLAAVEAGLDHPDEDLPALAGDDLASRIRRLQKEIAALAQTHRVGRVLAEGARIAIIGRPNVGKSSLLNALLGRERAIVSEIPGTTRDTLEEWADVGGIQAQFIDTAGLRERAADAVEQIGMERTRKALSACDMALVVLDQSQSLQTEDRMILDEVVKVCSSEERPVIVVMNKCDLPRNFTIEHLPFVTPAQAGVHHKEISLYMDSRLRGNDEVGENGDTRRPWCMVSVSALKGFGLPDLISIVFKKLTTPAADAESGAVVTSLRHRQSLEQASASLETALSHLDEAELAAVHLREALAALAGIVGETTSEDILKSVFSQFCIGK